VPIVSVIVPALNAAATLGRTLDALADQDLDADYEVIVVDNASSDDTASIVEQAPGPITFVRRRTQAGVGAARNEGAERSRGEVLAFTDADCVPASSWLREGLVSLKDADLVQGMVTPDPSATRAPFDRTVWVVQESGLYETANLFIRRELFKRIGGFQDWLGSLDTPFGEDVWLGWRARRAGARTAFSERALVHHAVFPRKAGDYVGERCRLVYFPDMIGKIPELRRSFLYRKWFLTQRSAAFDAAVLAVAGALAVRRRAPQLIPLAMLAALPYLRLAGCTALGWGRHAPKVAAADVASDTVGLAALIWGSARRRTLVL